MRWGVEVVAGGNFSWNHGVDYAALLARSGMADLVEAIYAKSGVSLQADLRQLAQAPRISADAAAVAAAETLTSYSGAIAGPVIVVDNIGDPVDADAYKRAYERTVARAGRARAAAHDVGALRAPCEPVGAREAGRLREADRAARHRRVERDDAAKR